MRIIAGVTLIVLGSSLRLWAIITLKEQWSEILRWPTRLVTNGPYRFVAHPAYYGSILMIAGVALLEPAVAIIWLAYAFYKSRMVVENEMIEDLKRRKSA